MDFGGLGAGGMGAAQANGNVDLMSWYDLDDDDIIITAVVVFVVVIVADIVEDTIEDVFNCGSESSNISIAHVLGWFLTIDQNILSLSFLLYS